MLIEKPSEDPNPVDENDPSVQVRVDLWEKMNMTQLLKQRELLLDKVSKLQSMMDAFPNPSILNLYSAIQMGLKDVNKLIDEKMAQKR